MLNGKELEKYCLLDKGNTYILQEHCSILSHDQGGPMVGPMCEAHLSSERREHCFQTI